MSRSAPRTSAKTRLALSFFALLLAGSAIALLVIRGVLLDQVDRRAEAELDQQITELQRLTDSIQSPAPGLTIEDDLAALFATFLAIDPPGPNEAVVTVGGGQVRETVGSLVAADGPVIDPDQAREWASSSLLLAGTAQTIAGPAHVRVVPVDVNDQRGHLILAVFTGPERATIERAIQFSGLVLLVFLAVGAAGTYVLARRALAPLDTLTATARRITEAELHERIEVAGSDEIAELGVTFNEMLDRLDDAFAHQRRLVRDVGHELRTPLTIASGHLEFVAETPDNREALAVVRGEHARMRVLIDDLLVLARPDARDLRALELVDLTQFTEELLDRARALADRDWTLQNERAGLVEADPLRLRQAMINLVSNAIAHTGDGDRVQIGARCEGDLATLWVSDSGPGIPPADRDRVLKPFERGKDAEPGSGSGLGLAIARRIAQAHSGGIAVEESDLGGARIRITFPIDQPEEGSQP